MAFAAMSGIPPFISFWLKISIFNILLVESEFFLALLSLASGLILMFFYLQNYRFSGNIKFTWKFYILFLNYSYIILIILIGCIIINYFFIYFINDLINWNMLICNFELLNGYV
jgi:NADH:ubiquinone oxidoreductase subunit 2 (subunit N)